jgi:hypothetical protein
MPEPETLTYEQALAEGTRVGVGRCSDAAVMAHFCEYNIQILCGAVSPKLVWEGARKKDMTARDLAHLAATDAMAVADLMFSVL